MSYFDQNRYQTADYSAFPIVRRFGKVLIECFKDNKKVATHPKKYGNHEWSLCISHYTKTLKRKPGALSQSLALKQSDKRLQQIYKTYYTANPKDFIELLEYIAEVGEVKVYDTIEKLEKITPIDISTDKIKLIYRRKTNEEHCTGDPKILDASTNNILRINELFGIKSTDYQKEAIL